MDRKQQIIQGAKIELARREFFFYCQLKAPDFYKSDRTFLVNRKRKIASTLTFLGGCFAATDI